MADLEGFRVAVRECRRSAGRTQQQLARAIGMHPNVLSHKLNGSDGALLNSADVIAMVTTLAEWGAISSRAKAESLLALMGVPAHVIPAQRWAAPPLGSLAEAGPDDRSFAREAGPAVPPAAGGGLDRSRLVPVPTPVTALVGRTAEVAAVAAALDASRLVTLTGVGGTGKTRVALAAAVSLADRFPDGVAFADLAPVADPALVALTLARAVGLAPRSVAGAEAQLTEALGPARLLVVADNMEHLMEAAPLLARLLAAAPGLHLLVTSRVPLRLYGEHQLRVPPLRLTPQSGQADGSGTASEAAELFVTRAQAVIPEFDPQGDTLAIVASICSVLDGLPLAIELAAARVKLYSPGALLGLLSARLPLLTGGPRDLPRRQQALHATLQWSEALLTPPARRLFARLGAFAGPFDADAADAVSDEPEGDTPMLERLDALAEHSLLEMTAGTVPRFRMLETLREYALARLAQAGDAEAVRAAHLRHYLTLAVEARASLDGADQSDRLDRLQADLANIYAALDWARARAEIDGACLEDGLRLATAVAKVWRRRASVAAGRLHLERLLAIDARRGAAAPEVRAWALLEAAALACFACDFAHAGALSSEALALCETLGDLTGQSWAHRYLGVAALGVGDLATAEPHFVSQLAAACRAENRLAEANAYNMLGQVRRYQRRYHDAEVLFERALGAFQSAGDPDGAASVVNSLGEVARDAGQAAKCRSLFRRALRDHYLVGSKRGIASDLEGIAAADALDGKGQSALVYLAAAKNLRDAWGWQLSPAEHADLDRVLDAAVVTLSPRQRQDAIAEGRNRPLAEIIDQALQPCACRE